MKKHYAFILCLVAVLIPVSSSAIMLSLEVSDPVGDNFGNIDLLGTTLTFENTTGDYTIEVRSSAANPFVGGVRINWNSWNETRSNFFFDNLNDFNLLSPVTSLTLTGTSAALTSWQSGDQIFMSTVGSSAPVGFASGVSVITSVGSLASDNFPAGATSINGGARDVPDGGSTAALLATAALGVFALRRRLKA